ncbi:hypothetical protein ABB37_09498 [Leptomonas pyrrhocoris]|uniref:Uncharacterized protein n=1 Tax=Leptomonas pyrrhocoris TaxID=157538 RepID=A0A0M9FQE8_LEPPY|nr:hypothetical protein ABB37_09498 [Leptomonas pyrrhocoris]XP_015652313.1 hypothetical protein ABB37_09498 [Leptomonas pyrrhocoris]XP_015652314.1 hypothetical protein ABB37_09498 [Leptomonas pyrrhocoris]KPA73873.1 hypothetical protein ABB37_09498 [Leptomonas pyrrhocoris]KPA73874.1 hypothetical protein ABB37_09498 [Leptomonas pyrrhocoris]KPA73875.1 hypothetical protein ABB37_09498 [Leptomonas pyrrhocoris]|eukprot:XP_015652312.1 hypothetical protein ABB37_09498 [Leptomonas pyrrhocoris]
MQLLLSRCQDVGAAVERCAEALARLSTSPSAAASDISSDSSSASAAPAATASYRQLSWSLSQFHTHVARLLSAASLQAYDAAVADKIASRLSLMERGAATFYRSVASAQQPAGATAESTAAVQGSARQLEQLACTRFAPAYEGFLLYAVATLGDFCALWDTAAQKSAEEVVWSSGQAGQSPMVAPLHAEHFCAVAPSRTSSYKKPKQRSPLMDLLKSTDAHVAPKKRHTSLKTLSDDFAAAAGAVEELRDALFAYVYLLHDTIHQFNVAATVLTGALSAVSSGTMAAMLADCTQNIAQLDSTLINSRPRMTTRRSCYEMIMADGVLRQLRQLQDDSKKGVGLVALFDAANYALTGKPSSASGHTPHRLTEPPSKETVSGHASRRSSNTHLPSCPLEVLFDVWYTMSELCTQIGTDFSDDFTKQVSL